MEFKLYDRKFKLIGEDLYSFYGRNGSKTKKWYPVKLNNDKNGPDWCRFFPLGSG